VVELVGEGALKKQYDLLKKKLSAEGLFDDARKRDMPEYPVRVGLLTSKTGAVIHDFQSNLGPFGYKLRFEDIRVEGAQAIPDILAGLERMKKESLDVLVLIRGGGSMESLQAFNHEQVVRAIAAFPVPVVCAIGHDKDVPLAQLVADVAPSTPTACTEILNRSWREAIHAVSAFTTDIMVRYHDTLRSRGDRLRQYSDTLQTALLRIIGRFRESTEHLSGALLMIGQMLSRRHEGLKGFYSMILSGYGESLKRVDRAITEENKILLINNPTRQLKLGFSILSRAGSIVRSAKDLPPGVDFEATLSDGTLMATSKGKKPITT
jgi:exodeoxyribonuclease VII large subunit